MRVGGGLSSVPRIARDMGVFVPQDEAIDVLRAILDAWKEDLRYRVSRVKARLKFMIDDIGADGMRERVEARLGRTLDGLRRCRRSHRARRPHGHPRAEAAGAASTSASRSTSASSAATRCSRVADLAEAIGGDVRVTRQQNFVLANVPEARGRRVAARARRRSASRST